MGGGARDTVSLRQSCTASICSGIGASLDKAAVLHSACQVVHYPNSTLPASCMPNTHFFLSCANKHLRGVADEVRHLPRAFEEGLQTHTPPRLRHRTTAAEMVGKRDSMVKWCERGAGLIFKCKEAGRCAQRQPCLAEEGVKAIMGGHCRHSRSKDVAPVAATQPLENHLQQVLRKGVEVGGHH